MTRIGCTGHQGLTVNTQRRIAAAVADLLAAQDAEIVTGLCSLAEGADQIFAFALLAAGGRLHVVLPSERYLTTFTASRPRRNYKALLAAAEHKETLPFDEPNEDAFLAAGLHIADSCDLLVALWDGRRAVGKGGTGDVVSHALASGRNVEVIWPEGSRRL